MSNKYILTGVHNNKKRTPYVVTNYRSVDKRIYKVTIKDVDKNCIDVINLSYEQFKRLSKIDIKSNNPITNILYTGPIFPNISLYYNYNKWSKISSFEDRDLTFIYNFISYSEKYSIDSIYLYRKYIFITGSKFTDQIEVNSISDFCYRDDKIGEICRDIIKNKSHIISFY